MQNSTQDQLLDEARHRLITAKWLWTEAADCHENLHWSREQLADRHHEAAQDTVEYAVRLLHAAGLHPAAITTELAKAGIATGITTAAESTP